MSHVLQTLLGRATKPVTTCHFQLSHSSHWILPFVLLAFINILDLLIIHRSVFKERFMGWLLTLLCWNWSINFSEAFVESVFTEHFQCAQQQREIEREIKRQRQGSLICVSFQHFAYPLVVWEWDSTVVIFVSHIPSTLAWLTEDAARSITSHILFRAFLPQGISLRVH